MRQKSKVRNDCLTAQMTSVQGLALSYALCGLMLLMSTGEVYASTSVARVDAYDYDSTTGFLSKHIVEPGNSDLCSVITYSYNSLLGVIQSTTARNCNGSAGIYPGSSAATNTEATTPGASSTAPFVARTSSSVVTYNTDGTFTVVNTSAESESETKVFGGAYGELKSNADPNSLNANWQYDLLGRKTLETRPDGTGTKWTYEYCSGINNGKATCPATLNKNSTYSVTAYPFYVITEQPIGTNSQSNGAYTKRYYDIYDRVIRVETQGFDAGVDGTLLSTIILIYQDTSYNDLGKVATKSRPYYQGNSPVVDRYKYDSLGRLLNITAADATTISYNYNGLVRTITNTDGKATIETRDESGQVVKVTDAYSKDLASSYDPFGNITQTVDSAGNTTAMQYDARGRKYAMQDPDLGSWVYSYNAMGDLVKQTDAKAQSTSFTYDRIHRLTAKVEPNLNTYWWYTKNANGSSCYMGIGKLCEATANNGYDRSYSYDSYGRLDATLTKVSGGVKAGYILGYGYDINGRLLEVDYPSGFYVQYAYTPLGYLWKMEDDVTTPTSVYWRAQAMDAEMHLKQQVYGNNVSTTNTYDSNNGRLKSTVAGANVQNISYDYWPLGNLKTRNDSITGVNASYTYDDISRLKTETLSGGGLTGQQIIAWDYDDIGNIQDRVDGSAYTYYGYTSAHPHAVTIATGNINGATLQNYKYDGNGNIYAVTGGGHAASVIWTSFNMVDTIQKTVGTTISTLNFKYGPEHDRVQELYTLNGALQRTTTYLSPGAASGVLLYEEERNELTAATKKKNYLNVGDNTIGVVTYIGAASSQQYWHKDNLGSVMAITDANGNLSEKLAYEPFGKRRQSNGLTDTNGTLVAINTERGFTEHEMMDEVGLVNMNGRIYDPAIGRFLSADPNIPHPEDMQSYSRYSYVQNNPLNGTDPSGFVSPGGPGWLPGIDGQPSNSSNSNLCVGTQVQFCLNLNGTTNGNVSVNGGVNVGGGSPAIPAPPAINNNNILGTGSSVGQSFNEGQYSDSLGLGSTSSNVERTSNSALTFNPIVDMGLRFAQQNLLALFRMCGWTCQDPGVQMSASMASAAVLGPEAGVLVLGELRLSANLATKEAALADLANFRGGLGLKAGEGTLSRLDVAGQSFYGINAHGQPITMSVNAITRTHAEADSFQQALNAGVNGGSGTLYVDRALCLACGQNGGVRSMARQLGLDQLTIITPQGSQIIWP